MSLAKTSMAAAGLFILLADQAHAQAVAFQPVVAPFPSGVMMSATPVVSKDRRYVRLTVTPEFTALQGFSTFSVPAAVSGGGIGTGGLGGGLGSGLNGGAGGGALPLLSAMASPEPALANSAAMALARPGINPKAAKKAPPPKKVELKIDGPPRRKAIQP